MRRFAELPGIGKVMRLGLATRGSTSLCGDDVHEAIARGVNWLNWCGHADGLCEAVRELGPRRAEVFVAVQFSARTGHDARIELNETLRALNTDYIDLVTYYYVEQDEEWQQIIASGGSAETLEAARREGVVGAIGLTSHQRRLAAKWARSGRLDLLMIRYNAAHRGAEEDIFPVTRSLSLPVVAFTCQRWGHLCRSTPDDPPAMQPPAPREWYRFVLSCPDISVALMAPDGRTELEDNLALLDDWRACSSEEWQRMASHGDRVKRHAGGFP